jgi:hypothetical protein
MSTHPWDNHPPAPDPLDPLADLEFDPLPWAIPEAGSSLRMPISRGYIVFELEEQEDDDIDDDTEAFLASLSVTTRMLSTWAGMVTQDIRAYREATGYVAWLDRAIERMEEHSPRESSLPPAIEEAWTRGYRLVMSAYQLERWRVRRLKIEGRDCEEDTNLANLRNALEHLDEARLSFYQAIPNPAIARPQSLKNLPDSRLFLGFHESYTRALFGLISLEELEDRARSVLRATAPPEADYEPAPDDRY